MPLSLYCSAYKVTNSRAARLPCVAIELMITRDLKLTMRYSFESILRGRQALQKKLTSQNLEYFFFIINRISLMYHGVNRMQDFDIEYFYEYATYVRQFHLQLM